MRKSKPNLAVGLSQGSLILKFIILGVALLIFFYSARFFVWRFLKTSDYFQIREIIFKENSPLELSYLKGHNIFTVNLKQEAKSLLDFYPAYRRLRFVRVLPDRLFVDFITRKPVAVVKLYRDFGVDEDSVLFDVRGEFANGDLPIISGLETKIFGPKSGARYHIKELDLALRIIGELSRQKRGGEFRLKRIDAATAAAATLYIGLKPQDQKDEVVLEVRLGQELIAGKLRILPDLIAQAKADWRNIKYIDLRFKEPVIKLKTNTEKR